MTPLFYALGGTPKDDVDSYSLVDGKAVRDNE